MADVGNLIFAACVAFAGGAGGAEALRAFREWRAGYASRHKRELQDLGRQLAQETAECREAEAEAERFERRLEEEREKRRDAERRAHMTLLTFRQLELLAISRGIPREDIPPLSY